MISLNKILIAFDGSKGSWRAVEWAVGLAGKVGAQLTAVTVVKPPEFSATIDEVEEFWQDAEKHMASQIAKLKLFGERNEMDIKTVFLRGHPAENIVKYAVDNDMDLIVMGTRGLGGFTSMVIGSVAQKVTSYSSVPVTIIRE